MRGNVRQVNWVSSRKGFAWFCLLVGSRSVEFKERELHKNKKRGGEEIGVTCAPVTWAIAEKLKGLRHRSYREQKKRWDLAGREEGRKSVDCSLKPPFVLKPLFLRPLAPSQSALGERKRGGVLGGVDEEPPSDHSSFGGVARVR